MIGVKADDLQYEATSEQQVLLDKLLVSLQSPFEPQTDLDKAGTEQVFKKASDKALKKLIEEEFNSFVEVEDECIIVFACLLFDSAFSDHQIDCEEFQALFTKHNLGKSDSL